MNEQQGMIRIPSRSVRVGTDDAQRAQLAAQFRCHPTWLNDDLILQDVSLNAFWLDRWPVTNAQFLAFVEATQHPRPAWWGEGFPQRYAHHPVVGVSGLDAEAYASWVGKRLPTAIEWEAAVQHPEGKLFPWGDAFPGDVILPEDSRPSWASPGTHPVGTGNHGQSASGIEDFAGQVCEWTSRTMPHHGVMFRTLRGASWFHRDPVSFRSAFATNAHEGWRSVYTGFRCALNANSEPPAVPQTVPTGTPRHEAKRSPESFGKREDIQIQAGTGTSSHIRIHMPYLGGEWVDLSAPEGVSWDGQGLLNWYDRRDLQWQTATPTKASYVMSLPGIRLRATFTAGDDFVDQVFTVSNGTGKPGWFRSSSCFNLQSHPWFYDCEGLRTYTLTKQDQFVPVRTLQRPGECIRWITGSVGPELEELHRAMLAVTSQDGEWIIGCARADREGRFSVSMNPCFTCLHTDSSILVEQERSSRLRMFFLRGGLDTLLARLDDDIGAGVFE